MKVKSYLTSLIAFYNEVTSLLDEDRKVDVVSLDFSKAFDTIFPNTLVGKPGRYRLNKWMGSSVENCLSGWSNRVLIRGTKSSWRPVISGLLQG